MISIIIPVYNVEQYLPRCINSVLSQTYQNLEIILVDDGSKDNSGKICDEYSQKDRRIKTIHLENGGVGKARNIAMEHVSGEWFGFIDSDDWIEPDYIETLYNNAVANNCFVSGAGHYKDTEYKLQKDSSNTEFKILESSKDCIHNFICPGLSLTGMVWGKLYRTEQFGYIRFDTELKVNEDCLYSYNIFKSCERACVTSERLYHYYMRQDSACHSTQTKIDFSAANVFLTLLDKTTEYQDGEIERTLWGCYVKAVSHMLCLVDCDREETSVKEAIVRLKEKRGFVWNCLDFKQKAKLVCALYFPFVSKVRVLK